MTTTFERLRKIEVNLLDIDTDLYEEELVVEDEAYKRETIDDIYRLAQHMIHSLENIQDSVLLLRDTVID